MSCPQGLTLSGKMCTIAPILSCPSGYTLVNGMCQEDSGVQGFGDSSMNIPPSDNARLALGEVAPPPQAQAQPETPVTTASQQPSILNEVGEKLVQGLYGDQPSSVFGQQTMEQIKSVLPLPVRSPNAPQIQPLASPMPMRPLSPQRRQQPRMMAGTPIPPPPMRSPTPTRVAPIAGSGVQPCPAGYSLNRADGMCYPL
jgi:hypothetical protein